MPAAQSTAAEGIGIAVGSRPRSRCGDEAHAGTARWGHTPLPSVHQWPRGSSRGAQGCKQVLGQTRGDDIQRTKKKFTLAQ
eukprot:scaffold54510_cov69-Phaeocystis_antarctica.AAC.7